MPGSHQFGHHEAPRLGCLGLGRGNVATRPNPSPGGRGDEPPCPAMGQAVCHGSACTPLVQSNSRGDVLECLLDGHLLAVILDMHLRATRRGRAVAVSDHTSMMCTGSVGVASISCANGGLYNHLKGNRSKCASMTHVDDRFDHGNPSLHSHERVQASKETEKNIVQGEQGADADAVFVAIKTCVEGFVDHLWPQVRGRE